MSTMTLFRHQTFLEQLQLFIEKRGLRDDSAVFGGLGALLVARPSAAPTVAALELSTLLHASREMCNAGALSGVVADELRRHQKFTAPGRPSLHIVQLRRQQASTRQALSQSRQAFVRAAASFAREAGLEVPPRLSLESFIAGWLQAHVPLDR